MKWIGLFFFCSFAFPCCRPVNVVPSHIFRSISRCQAWLWTADRWPSVSPQPWVGGLPLDPARLWARSSGSKPLKSQSYGKYKTYLCASLSQPTEATKKQKNWSPIPSRTSLQNMCISFNSLSLLYVSLYLSLSLSIVWVNWESNRITAWQFLPVLWVWITTFIFHFFGKEKEKKNIKHKELTVPTKIILTYQESCRTSYTSFYCITVSI